MSIIKSQTPDGKTTYKAIGDTIKAVDGNRIQGYAVVFTDKGDKDLHGEYFDKRTNFWLNEHPVKGKPALLDHALDMKFKSIPIGVLDFAEEREIGIWIEGKLKERAEYEDMLRGWRQKGYIDLDDTDISKAANGMEKAVKTFFGTGKAQWSTGALPQSVEIADDGHIDSWALIESTAVLTPAEPDGTEISVKSAFDLLDNILNRVSTATVTKEANQEPKESDADNATPIDKQHPSNKDNDMPKVTELATKMEMSEEEMRSFARTVAGVIREMNDEYRMNEEDVAETVNMDDLPDEEKMDEMDEDQKAELISDKMYQGALALMNAHQKRVNTQADRLRAKAEEHTLRNAPSEPMAKGGDQRPASHIPQVEVRTKFERAGWTAEDYSFALMLGGANNTNTAINGAKSLAQDETFIRAFADTAMKSFNSGAIRLGKDALGTIKSIKANEVMYSTQSGFGDENVPTVWADNIWEKPRIDVVVPSLLETVEMPSNPYEYPVENTDPTVFFVPETTTTDGLSLDATSPAIPNTKIGTSKVTFNAKKLGMNIFISAELQEDGLTRLVPKYRAQAEKALLEAQDSVVFNGDTATTLNINADGETITATTRNYQAYDGLIHQALVLGSTKTDAGGSPPTLAHIRATRSLLGNTIKGNPSNLAIICDPSTYVALLSIDAIQTIDKYGDQATVVRGELGRIDGMRVFQTDQMALADADGKISDGGNAVERGRLLLIHVPSWLVGYRRRIAQYLQFLPHYDTHVLSMTMRNSLVGQTYADGAQSATDDRAAILYNIGV